MKELREKPKCPYCKQKKSVSGNGTPKNQMYQWYCNGCRKYFSDLTVLQLPGTKYPDWFIVVTLFEYHKLKRKFRLSENKAMRKIRTMVGIWWFFYNIFQQVEENNYTELLKKDWKQMFKYGTGLFENKKREYTRYWYWISRQTIGNWIKKYSYLLKNSNLRKDMELIFDLKIGKIFRTTHKISIIDESRKTDLFYKPMIIFKRELTPKERIAEIKNVISKVKVIYLDINVDNEDVDPYEWIKEQFIVKDISEFPKEIDKEKILLKNKIESLIHYPQLLKFI